MDKEWKSDLYSDVETEASWRHKIAADVRTYAEIAGVRAMDPQYLAGLVIAEAIVLRGLGVTGVPVEGPLT